MTEAIAVFVIFGGCVSVMGALAWFSFYSRNRGLRLCASLVIALLSAVAAVLLYREGSFGPFVFAVVGALMTAGGAVSEYHLTKGRGE